MSYKDTGLIFAGNVYMAPIVNEVPTDFAGPINVTQLELTPPSPEAIDRTSYQRDTYGQVLDSVNHPQTILATSVVPGCRLQYMYCLLRDYKRL